ncbi:hypothetical protein [Pseudomonas lurida]|uniref:hypothetical protein n=1 Tax=Pseudomonas lurida TaxID=244566 RepID=UPI0017844639|nr:hypothetical protein [Pseudomonas lurida]MBD8671632.1 hypothetical protein [Pseudomonas lurida]
MAGLKGLTRADADTRNELASKSNDEAAAAFIGSAPVRSAPAEPRTPEPALTKKKKGTGPKFVRTNFSLDAKSIKQIDKLELYPRTFKVTRSDVVRAGLLALESMDKKAAIALLAKVSGAEPDEQEL